MSKFSDRFESPKELEDFLNNHYSKIIDMSPLDARPFATCLRALVKERDELKKALLKIIEVCDHSNPMKLFADLSFAVIQAKDVIKEDTKELPDNRPWVVEYEEVNGNRDVFLHRFNEKEQAEEFVRQRQGLIMLTDRILKHHIFRDGDAVSQKSKLQDKSPCGVGIKNGEKS